MKHFFLITLLTCLNCSWIWAQKKNSFGIRAGYLHSSTLINSTNSVSRFDLNVLTFIKAKPGFYLGLSYENSLSTSVISQVELNFQQKGARFLTPTGENQAYNYIGITPTIGIVPIRNLSFSIGPEVNFLISRSTIWSHSKPVEIGVVGRGRYQINRIGITGGYFRGLSKYDRMNSNTIFFVNQNWQVGLFYLLSKK